MTVAGTTDAPMPVTFHPGPADIDIEFILQEIRTYLSDDVTGDFYNFVIDVVYSIFDDVTLDE